MITNRKVSAICALITGLFILVYGLCLLIFKDTVTNKDILIVLLAGIAYMGYCFDMYRR